MSQSDWMRLTTGGMINSFPGMASATQVATPSRFKRSPRHRKTAEDHIAILTSDGGKPFFGNHQNFIDIIRTGKSMGVTVSIVTPKSFCLGDQQVMGYLRNAKAEWVHTRLPMPSVIYNRIPTRKAEQSKAVQGAIQKITAMPHVQFFNPHFFNKWDLYQILMNSEGLDRFVPATRLLRTSQDLRELLLHYSLLYLKPIDGKAGIGMMRIQHVPKGYELTHQSATGNKTYTLSNIKSLWSQIRAFMQQKQYVIQEGIRLTRYQGRPFDVRMLFQKNREGIWDVSGVGIRVAGKQAISTHVPMGGSIANAEDVFEELFGEQKEEIFARLKEIGIEIVQYIEHEQGGIFGEMSMDIGLESDGTPWFFEANSKPMKFDEPDIRSQSLRRIIEYSLYLTHGPEQGGLQRESS